MASFITDLWESIFTPGPTPTILKATNVTFAALQAVLFSLLLATHSVHCVVLSVLCAGLWWSVNWFASELQAVQKREAEEEAKRQATRADDSSDTEVEADRLAGDAPASAATGTRRQGALRQRVENLSPAGTQSSASTEDEWEKVSENEKEKDK